MGIGATTAIFSVADGVLLRALPYAGADRIAILWQRSPGLNVAQDWLSIGQYLDVAGGNTAFEQTAAAINASFNMTGGAQPERVDGIRVTSSFFPLFGGQPVLGRVFTADDAHPGGPPAVILSNGFWKRRFGSDSAVIGKTLTLNGSALTVVGVMGEGFVLNREVMPTVNGIERADVLLPLPLPASAQSRRAGEDFNVFAKLKRGVTVAEAQAQMNAVAARMKEQYPAFYPPNGGLTISVVPLMDQVVGDARRTVYVLLGSVALLLLVACANVANLLLARAAVREKEMAIRAAVGARRARLIRQLLTEQAVLACGGGVGGLALAVLAIGSLRMFGPANIPRMNEIGSRLAGTRVHRRDVAARAAGVRAGSGAPGGRGGPERIAETRRSRFDRFEVAGIRARATVEGADCRRGGPFAPAPHRRGPADPQLRAGDEREPRIRSAQRAVVPPLASRGPLRQTGSSRAVLPPARGSAQGATRRRGCKRDASF